MTTAVAASRGDVTFRDVDVEGLRTNVTIRGGHIVQVGEHPPSGDVVEGHGGALLPGLHDHHLHLMAMSARASSIDASNGLTELPAGKGWLRVVGWDGETDRHFLDQVCPGRPLRVMHRSGALWMLNSAAIAALDLDRVRLPGVERDELDRPTGRLWRLDGWLSEKLGSAPPDLRHVEARLARYGITGVTDATPDLDPAACSNLRSMRQRVHLLGDPHGNEPVKIVLSEHALPDLTSLVDMLRRVRPRPVALHAVSREAVVLAINSLDDVGRADGDRLEHGALIPDELLDRVPTCVTQPGFIHARGDRYIELLGASDLRDLYRYSSLLGAGITCVPSSDAPHGPLDPWLILRTARDRRTSSGYRLGDAERVDVRRALDGMLMPPTLVGSPRRIRVGAEADLVLLHGGLREIRHDPHEERVRSTWIRGEQVYVA